MTIAEGAGTLKSWVMENRYLELFFLIYDAAWDTFVKNHKYGSIFHTMAWRDAVKRTFGHEDIYLLAERDGVIVGAVPMFLVNSRFAGRSLVSVPLRIFIFRV